jgi:hypothetical protein
MIIESSPQPDIKPTKVKVLEPFRIVHDAKEYFAGDAVTAPAHLAQEWTRAGWVEPVSTTKG